jgi:ribitol-5-phosphate 2-dehydrogenase (NADP+) / D-ribitol-5-phosphate cytidylyltransferase
MSEKVIAVILAAGTGERAGHHLPKQFVKIAGKTVLEHTLDTVERSRFVDHIYVVVHARYRHAAESLLERNRYTKVAKLLNGGDTRQESSRIAVNAVDGDRTKVLVHDAVRPFISEEIIRDCVLALDTHEAVDVAIPAGDTIIQVDASRIIRDIPNRACMFRGQTPQAFRAGVLRHAHMLAMQDRASDFTDDCGLVLRYELAPVYVVCGEQKNIKITYPEDIFLADKLFQLNALQACTATSLSALRGKVLVVFGASRGIGRSVCDLAETSGARVHGFSRSSGCNVAVRMEIETALREVCLKTNRIDYVVNTAGVLKMGKVEDRNRDDIAEEIATNFTGAVNVVQASIPYLRKSKGGMLLFTSSSHTRGRALYSVYSSTKAAIVNFMQAVSEELFHDQVRINAINPERTATPMRFENFGKEPEETLLSPVRVAEVSLQTLLSGLTGQVIYATR